MIADFHDGDLENPSSKAEFQAIKKAVLADVSVSTHLTMYMSADKIG